MFGERVTLRSGRVVRQLAVGRYWADHHEGNGTLVVTFDNAATPAHARGPLADAWSLPFLADQGFSVLGIKPPDSDWYRGPLLHQWFRSGAFAGFLAGYDDVAFIGGSMGGFAALAFSSVCPGALVLAHNPQSTLDPRLVPWERRWPEAAALDWSGDFADAAAPSQAARRVYVTYDPHLAPDAMHVARLAPHNLAPLKMPFLEHGTPASLSDLGLLKPVTLGALAGTLTPASFSRLIRARRNHPDYHVNLALAQRRRGRNASAGALVRRALAIAPLHGRAAALQRELGG